MITILIIAKVVLSIVCYRYVNNRLEPVDANSEEVSEVEIPSCSSRLDIALILEEYELINSSLVFDFYVRFNDESNFQAGTYLMSPSMSVDEIVDYLNEGGTPIMDLPLASITIPEGVHIENIAERFEENTDFSSDEFMYIIQDPTFIDRM